MHGTDTLNRASESIARSTRAAVETGKFVIFSVQGQLLAYSCQRTQLVSYKRVQPFHFSLHLQRLFIWVNLVHTIDIMK